MAEYPRKFTETIPIEEHHRPNRKKIHEIFTAP